MVNSTQFVAREAAKGFAFNTQKHSLRRRVSGRGARCRQSACTSQRCRGCPSQGASNSGRGASRSKNRSTGTASWSLRRATGACTSAIVNPSLDRRSHRLGKQTEPPPKRNSGPLAPGRSTISTKSSGTRRAAASSGWRSRAAVAPTWAAMASAISVDSGSMPRAPRTPCPDACWFNSVLYASAAWGVGTPLDPIYEVERPDAEPPTELGPEVAVEKRQVRWRRHSSTLGRTSRSASSRRAEPRQ